MFQPDRGLFAFRLRRDQGRDVLEGVSPRYTAIVLIAARYESSDTVERILAGRSVESTLNYLLDAALQTDDIGEAALALWAASVHGHAGAGAVSERMRTLDPVAGRWPTVEVAWCLTALTQADGFDDEALATRIAARLLASFERESGLFSHWPSGASASPLRRHVACFADLVYPIQALSHYYKLTDSQKALAAARQCAETMCRLQGHEGQWWWHFDTRRGSVVERYPVYAVHQDAMGPMALFALEDASGDRHHDAVRRSIEWLMNPPEIYDSLVDRDADVIWRKVGRREPGKLSRTAQALASRVHPDLRAPLIDKTFPPVRVDFETRPYHMGWLLYAFSEQRVAQLNSIFSAESPTAQA